MKKEINKDKDLKAVSGGAASDTLENMTGLGGEGGVGPGGMKWDITAQIRSNVQKATQNATASGAGATAMNAGGINQSNSQA